MSIFSADTSSSTGSGKSTTPPWPTDSLSARIRRKRQVRRASLAAGKEGFAVVSLSVAIGLLASLLLSGTAWGLGATLWSLVFVIALIGVTTDWTTRIARKHLWVVVPLLLLPFAFLLRSSPVLVAANVAALITLSAVWVTILRSDDESSVDIPFFRVLRKLVRTYPVYAAAQIDLSQLTTPERAPFLRSMVRGTLLAAPFMFFFGLLLASADPRFADILAVPANLDLDNLGTILLYSFGAAWFAGMLMMGCTASFRNNPLISIKAPRLRVNVTEASVVLGAVSALFLGFVLTQLSGILDGSTSRDLVAHNARTGFFNMAIVATVSLVLVTSLRKRIVFDSSSGLMQFGKFATVNALLVLSILGFAAAQMYTYTATYGWTDLRLNTSFAMLWTAILFVALIASMFRKPSTQRDSVGLAKTGIVAAYLLLGGMHLLNPHAFIARHNMAFNNGESLDTYYLGHLSEDAIPAIVKNWDNLSIQDRAALAVHWRDRFGTSGRYTTGASDWRAWTIGRARATKAINSNRVKLSLSDGALNALRSANPPAPGVDSASGNLQTDGT